jgi:cytochrome c oxidase subunit II
MKRNFLLVIVLLGCFFAPAAPSSYSQGTAQAIEVHAKRFSFTPSEITVKKGETVKLNLISDDVTHELEIPDLQVKQEVSKGKPAEVTFVPDKAGDFSGMCGHFCGAGHTSMKFIVLVKDN